MNELKLNHPSEEHGDDWWIFQEYVERLIYDGDVLNEDEVDELETLEEEYDWCRYDCELL